MKQSRA